MITSETVTASTVRFLNDASGKLQAAVGKMNEVNGVIKNTVAIPPTGATAVSAVSNVQADLSVVLASLAGASEAMTVAVKIVTDAVIAGMPSGSLITGALQTDITGVKTAIDAEITYLKAQGLALTATNISSATLKTNFIGARDDINNQQSFLQKTANELAFSLPHSPSSAYYVSPVGGQIVMPPAAPTTVSKASATAQGVTFTAVKAGLAGNSISLVFDGTDTVNDVCTAWNSANASNTVEYTGLGTVVLTVVTVALAGAVDTVVAPPSFSIPAVIA